MEDSNFPALDIEEIRKTNPASIFRWPYLIATREIIDF